MRKCPGQRLHLKPHLQVIYTARSNTSLSLTNKSMVSRLSYDFPVQSSHKSKIVEDFWVFKFFRCSVEGKHLIRFQRDSSVLKSLWRSISRKLSQLGRCPRLTLSWRDFLITWNTIACLKCSYSSYHLKIMVKICPINIVVTGNSENLGALLFIDFYLFCVWCSLLYNGHFVTINLKKKSSSGINKMKKVRWPTWRV